MPDRAALVTGLIMERPLCEPCILLKSGLSRADFQETLAGVRTALLIHDEIARCRECGAITRVLSLDRPR